MAEIDFWSYASGLAEFPGSEQTIFKSGLVKEVFCKQDEKPGVPV